VKRTFVAVALAVIFVLALAAPALASMTHTATYEMEGVINFKKQAGHACNTGGVLKQTIAGSGKMDKVMDIAMVPGKLTVADQNDWVAGATPLTVTSVWELCTPPKYTYDGRDAMGRVVTAPVDTAGGLYTPAVAAAGILGYGVRSDSSLPGQGLWMGSFNWPDLGCSSPSRPRLLRQLAPKRRSSLRPLLGNQWNRRA